MPEEPVSAFIVRSRGPFPPRGPQPIRPDPPAEGSTAAEVRRRADMFNAENLEYWKQRGILKVALDVNSMTIDIDEDLREKITVTGTSAGAVRQYFIEAYELPSKDPAAWAWVERQLDGLA